MAVRHNTSPNPSLKTVATGWFGPAGWARVAFGDPTLPRSAVWTGTLTGDVATPRFAVTPGKYYRAAIWGRAIAPSIFSTGLNWYTGGGAYISFSAGNDYNQTGGTTAVFDSGVGLAPAGAAEGLLNLAGVDGEAQFTAIIVLEFDTLGEGLAADMSFFDGDSANAVWDAGTDGTSTQSVDAPMVVALAVPPPVLRAVGLRRIIPASAHLTMAPPVLAVGLIAQITYDDTRGRIRILVSGMTPQVIRAIVYARRQGSTRWVEIRGGRVALAAGEFVRTLDHYEFIAGATMEYRVDGLSTSEGVPDVIVQSRVLTVQPTLEHAWVKFIPAPGSNRKVTLTDWDPLARRSRNAVYDVAARRDPVVVTDLHTARTTIVKFRTETLDERDALDEALSQGAPIFLHTPESCALPSLHAAIGDFQAERITRRGHRHLFTVALTEVAAPPISVVGAGTTYQTVLDGNATYADLLTRYATYADVIA